MNHDEKGYIQFECDWEDAESPPVPAAILTWRERLFRLGLIGVYPDGIGFGNVSTRFSGPLPVPRAPRFLISGTATGSLPLLAPEHFAEVADFNLARNWLKCRGKVKASSESLSHAAVYTSAPATWAVIHVHHLKLWERDRGRLPTTDPAAEAGTPAMALAIQRLLENEAVRQCGVFVMGGHREGLMAFGESIEEAGERLLKLLV